MIRSDGDFDHQRDMKERFFIHQFNWDSCFCSVYGRSRNWGKAVEMFNSAQIMGVALDEKIYTNMICTYGKAGAALTLSL